MLTGRKKPNKHDASNDDSSEVKHLLHQPSDLENVLPLKKWQAESERLSVEVMIQTMKESHMTKIDKALSTIENTLKSVEQVEQVFNSTYEKLKGMHQVRQKLSKLREEYVKYRQYRTALEVSTQLMNVAESLDKVRALISEDKLLDAHLKISDLDRSREDLIVSICSLGPSNQVEIGYVFAYFSGIGEVYQGLGKKVFLIISRAINVVKKQPEVLVSALRIVEREEMADKISQQRTSEELVTKAGRPFAWKQRCLEVLENSVEDRIDACLKTERNHDKLWLVKHLEMMRLNIVDDFVCIKSSLLTCFPPSYEIDSFLCKKYHESLRSHISAIADGELLTEEIVNLLEWVREYDGPHCLKNPRINLLSSQLGEPLLDEENVKKLRERYIHGTVVMIEDWMLNALKKEIEDWNTDKAPETRHIGRTPQAVFTSMTQTVVQIIDQNVLIGKRIRCSEEIFAGGLHKLALFLEKYGDAMMTYRKSNFDRRLELKNYSNLLMAVANNALDFVSIIRKWNESEKEKNEEVNKGLIACWQACEHLRKATIKAILDEPFEDLKVHFRELCTPGWLKQNVRPIETLCATVDDYSGDYSRCLVESNFIYCMNYVQIYSMRQFLSAMMEKKLRCTNDAERKMLAERIEGDFLETMRSCFDAISPDSAQEQRQNYEVFNTLKDIFSSSPDMLGMVVPNLIRSGGASEQQACRLVDVRGDLKLDYSNLSRLDGPKLMLDLDTGNWKNSETGQNANVLTSFHIALNCVSRFKVV